MSDTTMPPVLPGPRRIVTSHDSEGKAVVSIDEIIPPSTLDGFDGIRTGAFWASTDARWLKEMQFGSEDGATRQVGNTANLGIFASNTINFRYTDIGPGVIAPMHRTPTIDYVILIKGEAILITDDGTERHLKNPGDV
ncbi:hypothetical protein AZE42_13653, partial [Rhizopogon vesiculosus]